MLTVAPWTMRACREAVVPASASSSAAVCAPSVGCAGSPRRSWANAPTSAGKLVGQIERGAGNPTLEVITGFAEALSVEPAALLQFEEDRAAGGVERAAGAFAAREQVTRYLARKPSAEVEKALRLLEVALGDAEKNDAQGSGLMSSPETT